MGWPRAAVGLELILSSDRGVWALYPMAHEFWGFQMWLLGTGIISGPVVNRKNYFPQSFQWFSGSFLTCITDPLRWRRLERDPCRSPELTLSDLALCPVDSGHLTSQDTHLHLLSSGKQLDLAWDPHLILRPRNTPQEEKWGNHRAHLECYQSLRDHCGLLPGVYNILKTFVSYFWSVF